MVVWFVDTRSSAQAGSAKPGLQSPHNRDYNRRITGTTIDAIRVGWGGPGRAGARARARTRAEARAPRARAGFPAPIRCCTRIGAGCYYYKTGTILATVIALTSCKSLVTSTVTVHGLQPGVGVVPT